MITYGKGWKKRTGTTYMEINEIEISKIRISGLNARKDLDAGTEDSGLVELANSISDKGLLSPITVKKTNDGKYDLIVGQRRFLACKKLGWSTIPAIIRDISDDTQGTIISLIENVHRADMNPIDKARAYNMIYEKYQDINIVVSETGVSITTIKKYLSLLKLSPSIQERLSTSDGPAGIATLSKIAEQYNLAQQAEVLDQLSGFNQQTQLEILKRSGGNFEKIEELREQALEGAFQTRLCKGLDECPHIPDDLLQEVKNMVHNFKSKE